MKRFFPICLAYFLFSNIASAQQQYTVGGEQYVLNTEVDGALTLLWGIIDGEYRYFLKKENEIIELKNTRENGDYLEEYKTTLQQQTADASIKTDKLKLTLPDLRDFFNTYNKQKDPNFTAENKSVALIFRLGGFAGASNLVYSANPTNAFLPIAGVEVELTDAVILKRHSLVFQFRQSFKSSEYEYTSSQFSMNYRFKFIKTPKLDVFVNTKIVAYTHSQMEKMYVDANNDLITEDVSGSNIEAPVAFGLGLDYALGNGYLTFLYSDIVALGIDNNGEFPMDFALGYKFNL